MAKQDKNPEKGTSPETFDWGGWLKDTTRDMGKPWPRDENGQPLPMSEVQRLEGKG